MNEDKLNELIKYSEEFTKTEKTHAAEYTELSYPEKLARRKGFVNALEYRNWQAQQKGFANDAEYYQYLNFKRGIGTGLSMAENKNSAKYLGEYIAEKILPKIFQEPRMMPHGNIGYDAICKNNFMIDVKSSVLRKANYWKFEIRQNKIAHAFLCIAFDNRIDLEVQHIWLIPGNNIIRNKKLNELRSLTIYNTKYSMINIVKYELTEKTEQANVICTMFKNRVVEVRT